MSVSDISEHLSSLYGTEIGRDTISRITDAVLEDIAAWRSRPLETLYPIVYFDALMVKMTEDRSVKNRACYLAVGVTLEGEREILGLWWQDTEGAKFWLAVLNDLHQRGVGDVLIACVDGLAGFPEAIAAVFPQASLSNFTEKNTAETLFERLEAHGRTWKVYVQEPMAISFTGVIHMPRLKDRFASNFVPYSEFEQDAANGTLPDFSLIEPNLTAGHSDYHPACGRSFIAGDMNIPLDPPSSIRGGEAFLARIYGAIRAAASPEGSNAYNTMFFIGWDEPGGTYDHVPPGPVPPPDPGAPAGQLGFKFDRSGYRVPAILVSPWVKEGTVINDEHRHTSMIATLRKVWDLGDAFSARDAAAAPFDHLLSRENPRDPTRWPHVTALPVPKFHMDLVQMEKALSTLGKTMGRGLLQHAKHAGIAIPTQLTDPNQHPTTEQIITALRNIATQLFPRLTPPT